jgi:hypothetical protein
MVDNVTRSRGTSASYKSDRGGVPNEPGPFIGIVMNNYDPARLGRIQVHIPEFGDDMSDSVHWRTVRYMSPFFGNTPHSGTTEGTGSSIEGNPNSYGMWFTVPDVGIKVLCFFVGGDPNQGYYAGCIPDVDAMHMVPAIGAEPIANVEFDNAEQQSRYANATRLPVGEINAKNKEIREDPQSFNQTRPIHSYLAAVMYQQGVITDRQRGPVGTSAYRESPSSAFGISTPGRPIYKSGITEYTINNSYGAATKEDFEVVGRKSGHTFIMDDGDAQGNDQLVRIRTAKGHQITMTDDGNAIHIMHANGQSWVELGKEGTVDVYAANSVNIRSQGDLNLHADQDLNLYAERHINLRGKANAFLETDGSLNLVGDKLVSIASKSNLSLLSENVVSIDAAKKCSVNGDSRLILNGGVMELNTSGKIPGAGAQRVVKTKLDDVSHTASGWVATPGELESCVSRAPTHEPYPHHNKGVVTQVTYDEGGSGTASSSVTDKLSQVSSTIGVRNS